MRVKWTQQQHVSWPLGQAPPCQTIMLFPLLLQDQFEIGMVVPGIGPSGGDDPQMGPGQREGRVQIWLNNQHIVTTRRAEACAGRVNGDGRHGGRQSN